VASNYFVGMLRWSNEIWAD